MHSSHVIVLPMIAIPLMASACAGTDVFEAAANGNTAAVKLLVRQGADIDSRDPHGATPLMHAARRGHLDVCTYLLSQGARVGVKDSKGFTAVDYLRTRVHDPRRMTRDEIEKFLGLKPKPGQMAPSLPASDQLALQRILRLLEKRLASERTESADVSKSRALFTATERGDTSRIAQLIKAGVDVDCTNEQGMTPLMVAASRGDPRMCEALIQQGAELSLVSRDGLSAFQYAKEFPEVRRLLEKERDDRDLRDVKALLASGFDVNRGNPRRGGRTMLMEAAAEGNLALCELLVQHGANVDATDSRGMKAVDHARESDLPQEEKQRVVRLLLPARNQRGPR